jgi:hypothetical protein
MVFKVSESSVINAPRGLDEDRRSLAIEHDIYQGLGVHPSQPGECKWESTSARLEPSSFARLPPDYRLDEILEISWLLTDCGREGLEEAKRNLVEVSLIELIVIHVPAQAIQYALDRFTFDSIADIP